MKRLVFLILIVSVTHVFGQSKDSLNFYLSKANEFQLKGNYEKSLSMCNLALRIDSNNCKAYKMKGINLSSLNRTDEEKALYQKAIKKSCNVVLNNLNLKSLYFNEGNNSEALNYLNKVIILKPDSGALYYERWSIKTIMKDSIGGMADLQKAKNLGFPSAIVMEKQLNQKDEVEQDDKD